MHADRSFSFSSRFRASPNDAADSPVEYFKQKLAQLIITAVIIVQEVPFARLRVGAARPREPHQLSHIAAAEQIADDYN